MSKSIWEADPKAWPKAARHYVFLAAAFNEVGRALFVDEWTGREAVPFPTPHADSKRKAEQLFKAAGLPPPLIMGRGAPPTRRGSLAASPRTVVLPKISDEDRARFVARQTELVAAEEADRKSSLSRRDGVAEWIAERARNGDLVTFGLWAGGGVPPVELDASVWNVTDDWQLFEGCTARRWQGSAGWHSYFLFLGAVSLRRELDAQQGPQVGKASAERKAEEWLRQRFADASTAGTPKGNFVREGRELFDGLSANAFERAWGKASADFPERRNPGRKPAQSV